MNKKPEEYIALANNKIGVILTRGMVATIDPESFPLVRGRRWCGYSKGGNSYASCSMKVGNGRKTVRMHHLILPPKDGLMCDHIDGDGLNNARANLRYASRHENARNKVPFGKSSRFKGVSYAPTFARVGKGKKWIARIGTGKKNVRLGLFDCEQCAALAFNEAAKIHHGEFAYLNPVDANHDCSALATIEQEQR